MQSGRLVRHPGAIVRWLAWTAGCVSGLLAGVMIPRDVRRREAADRWARRWRFWVRRTIDGPEPSTGSDYPPRSLDPLRGMLIGLSRGEVTSLFGPPPATSAQPLPKIRSGYWRAEVWYYPLDTRRRHAVAITFAQDVVVALDHVAGP